MSISCDCSRDDGEMPDFYHDSFPVARKAHTCCECGENIKPGQKYQKFIGKWYGEVSTYKTCMPCYNIREKYCPYGYIFTGLREAIGDCLGFDYTDVPEEEA